jgi:hypothetical protein
VCAAGWRGPGSTPGNNALAPSASESGLSRHSPANYPASVFTAAEGVESQSGCPSRRPLFGWKSLPSSTCRIVGLKPLSFRWPRFPSLPGRVCGQMIARASNGKMATNLGLLADEISQFLGSIIASIDRSLNKSKGPPTFDYQRLRVVRTDMQHAKRQLDNLRSATPDDTTLYSDRLRSQLSALENILSKCVANETFTQLGPSIPFQLSRGNRVDTLMGVRTNEPDDRASTSRRGTVRNTNQRKSAAETDDDR